MACGHALSNFCWCLVFYAIGFMQIAGDSVFRIIFSALDIPEEGLVAPLNTSSLRSTPLHYRYRLLMILLDSLNLKVAKTSHDHRRDCCHTPRSSERIFEACPSVVAGKVSSLARHQRSCINLLRLLSFGFLNNQRLLVSRSEM
jgi:hypothetical protein